MQLPQTHNKYLLPEPHGELAQRKCVVIDLDETLVHSSFKVLFPYLCICICNVNVKVWYIISLLRCLEGNFYVLTFNKRIFRTCHF